MQHKPFIVLHEFSSTFDVDKVEGRIENAYASKVELLRIPTDLELV